MVGARQFSASGGRLPPFQTCPLCGTRLRAWRDMTLCASCVKQGLTYRPLDRDDPWLRALRESIERWRAATAGETHRENDG